MASFITPTEHVTAHVRAFCAKRHLPLVVCKSKPDDTELEFKVCGRAVKFSAAEIAANADKLLELVAARIKAVMP